MLKAAFKVRKIIFQGALGKIALSLTSQPPAENTFIFNFYNTILLCTKVLFMAAFCREEKFQKEIKTNWYFLLHLSII